MVWILITALATAGPLGGLEWHPLSRADLVWVDEGRTSGVVVGEHDGVVAPALSGFLGWEIGSRVALTGHLGVARLTNTTLVDDVLTTTHWGVFRPGLDVRWSLAERTPGRAHAFLFLGGHANIPSARERSNGFTDEEQQAADEQAKVERARLGGAGGRLGIGAEAQVVPGLWIGANTAVELHHNTWRSEDLSEVSSFLSANAALLLTFYGPPKEP